MPGAGTFLIRPEGCSTRHPRWLLPFFKLLPHTHLSESSSALLHCCLYPRPSARSFHASVPVWPLHRFSHRSPSPMTASPDSLHRYCPPRRLCGVLIPAALGVLSAAPLLQLPKQGLSPRPLPPKGTTRLGRHRAAPPLSALLLHPRARVLPPGHPRGLRRSEPGPVSPLAAHDFRSQRGSLTRTVREKRR